QLARGGRRPARVPRAEKSGRPPSGQAVQAPPQSPTVIVPAEGIERELHLSIERQQLEVEYQPFVDRAGQRVLGVEALVRWRRDGETVPPATFVPIAEQTGFIEPMSEWVLRR